MTNGRDSGTRFGAAFSERAGGAGVAALELLCERLQLSKHSPMVHLASRPREGRRLTAGRRARERALASIWEPTGSLVC